MTQKHSDARSLATNALTPGKFERETVTLHWKTDYG